jgi:hypothetical protein
MGEDCRCVHSPVHEPRPLMGLPRMRSGLAATALAEMSWPATYCAMVMCTPLQNCSKGKERARALQSQALAGVTGGVPRAMLLPQHPAWTRRGAARQEEHSKSHQAFES